MGLPRWTHRLSTVNSAVGTPIQHEVSNAVTAHFHFTSLPLREIQIPNANLPKSKPHLAGAVGRRPARGLTSVPRHLEACLGWEGEEDGVHGALQADGPMQLLPRRALPRRRRRLPPRRPGRRLPEGAHAIPYGSPFPRRSHGSWGNAGLGFVFL